MSMKHLAGLLAGVSAVALTAPRARRPAGGPGGAVEEVVVTGSRIVAGFQAPTPVTVVSSPSY